MSEEFTEEIRNEGTNSRYKIVALLFFKSLHVIVLF